MSHRTKKEERTCNNRFHQAMKLLLIVGIASERSSSVHMPSHLPLAGMEGEYWRDVGPVRKPHQLTKPLEPVFLSRLETPISPAPLPSFQSDRAAADLEQHGAEEPQHPLGLPVGAVWPTSSGSLASGHE
ncbi:unnamed protein product [Darwinula stevensoni]|uniref:Uncharacterized protein n=1 Tax=Darwinula stevensoni TaxID=69355 RepID=A0A7R9FRT7_9CRUS|nr:unnamed protein product [Darwinula stevensoni]CAG0901619.1 unnamed protein product [Darwinula stevensoni]